MRWKGIIAKSLKCHEFSTVLQACFLWASVCVLLIAWPSWIIKMKFYAMKMLINLSWTAYFEMTMFKYANCSSFVKQNVIIIADRIEMLAITQWYASKPVLAFYGSVFFLWVAYILFCIYLWIGEHTGETKNIFLQTFVCSHPKVSQKDNIS